MAENAGAGELSVKAKERAMMKTKDRIIARHIRRYYSVNNNLKKFQDLGGFQILSPAMWRLKDSEIPPVPEYLELP